LCFKNFAEISKNLDRYRFENNYWTYYIGSIISEILKILMEIIAGQGFGVTKWNGLWP